MGKSLRQYLKDVDPDTLEEYDAERLRERKEKARDRAREVYKIYKEKKGN